MNPTKLFPLVVTEALAETKAYYVEKLGCEVVADMDNYLQVRFGADASAPELAFMSPQQGPMGGLSKPFGGDGLIVSVPTESADAKFRAVKQAKATIAAEPSDKPWGWRSFMVTDPSGVTLDFFHVIEQAAAADATG
ncbi:Glyoxalase/bleomycin resistance protein/dioxygenase [Enhygromyxa salina]|uniref:Glyoxalase/bleomycin resistance protein/dioxygenase n=1 Tax=Enhygromyxa salina TaxID=215803 RepID=A0A0C2D6K6_9BACT|nr:VOC family protein [Enhygromyxa salina]KIG15672.1 Glyoxalase/bleomycin resistance protein/dioxygenase [Enhygromyxa salina]